MWSTDDSISFFLCPEITEVFRSTIYLLQQVTEPVTNKYYSNHFGTCQEESYQNGLQLFKGVFVINYLKRLYDLRTDKDLRQEDIAKILGTTKQTYGRYENGKRDIKIDDLIKLAKFYNVSLDYIAGLTKDPTPHWTTKSSINKVDIQHSNINNSNINIKQG